MALLPALAGTHYLDAVDGRDVRWPLPSWGRSRSGMTLIATGLYDLAIIRGVETRED